MSDAFRLERFVEAQTRIYPDVLAEIRSGAKRSHWMWYVFPQLAGLGRSATAQQFAICSAAEARAYLDHAVLGPRYHECVSALQGLSGSGPAAVFGSVDAMKLRSSLTLFEAAQPAPLFAAALDRWFGGVRDIRTQELLGSADSA